MPEISAAFAPIKNEIAVGGAIGGAHKKQDCHLALIGL